VLIPESERLPLPEGEFYFSDFENFEAVDKDGNLVGKVLSAEEMPSVNVFNLLVGKSEVAIPWIDDCVLGVDMVGRRITVNVDYIENIV